MTGGYRVPIPPIIERAYAAIDALDNLARKAAWRMTKTDRRAIEAGAASIAELRDELRERNSEIQRVRAAIKELFGREVDGKLSPHETTMRHALQEALGFIRRHTSGRGTEEVSEVIAAALWPKGARDD